MSLLNNKTGNSFVAKLTRHIPPGQFARYLMVGIWNTAFGYGMFALITHLLEKVVPHSYMPAMLISSLLSITVAFFAYKWFVFKTKGNYLREWVRSVGVYSGNVLLNLALLPVLVYILRRSLGWQRQAPYVAGALLTGLIVLSSFYGHRNFSFRSADPDTKN
jgi:putative flippase GtrA